MIFQKDGEWRGRMPFRQSKAVKELLQRYRRTGEPSLAQLFSDLEAIHSDGHGKAAGSFTKKVRESLWAWVEKNFGSWATPISFEYKLSRKQIVTITGRYPWLFHNPGIGKGMRGFQLYLMVDSINGLPYRPRRAILAWNRIIGRERILMLEGGS